MSFYRGIYSNSWALIIGINEYKFVNKLDYACNDARAIAQILKEEYKFLEENVTILLDEEATKGKIMSAFLEFAKDKIQVDDRIIVFYAGHGHTVPGRRGDIGFLVPFDGTPNDLSTLIRWDELTRNSELIRAKHLFYVMDACYSGLAITRALQPGSVRYLKDMLKRNSRQVLTAGKANEVVADSNGPIAGHSIFTGHLLQGLQGNAEAADGILTANGLMAYVYEKVSKDVYSDQTPHFGFLEGDGDLIFKGPILEDHDEEAEIDQDYFVEIPAVMTTNNRFNLEDIIEETKEYLTDEKYRIKLDDLVNQQLRKIISVFTEENFPLQTNNCSAEDFVERLRKYEDAVECIRLITCCIAHWGTDKQLATINRIMTRMAEHIEQKGGNMLWLNLRWYPILYIMYSAGISALARDNYEFLAKILTTKINEPNEVTAREIILPAVSYLVEINDTFKTIPEYKQRYVPRSDYIHKTLQPSLDDLLFLGKSYDTLFDRFEIFLGLVFADLYSEEGHWGPLGRFAWKYIRSKKVYSELIQEAERYKQNWPPIKAGLFRGSYERFKIIAEGYQKLLNELRWF